MIAEAAGVPVSTAFKSGHLLSDSSLTPSEAEGAAAREGVKEGGKDKATAVARAGVVAPTEVMPVAKLEPEPDAIEELVAGRCGALLIVPKDTRCNPSPAATTAAEVNPRGASEEDHDAKGAAEAATAPAAANVPPVVLREGEVVRMALPPGATIVLPGSYNPLHRGHLGLLEAARALLRAKIKHDSLSTKIPPQGSASSASAPASVSAAISDENANGKTEAAASARRGGQGGHGRRVGSVVGGNNDGSITVHAVFEVSVANVDKAGLTVEEVRRRAKQFSDPGGMGWPHPVVVTRAPLFSQKVSCAFVRLCLTAVVCVYSVFSATRPKVGLRTPILANALRQPGCGHVGQLVFFSPAW